MLRVQPVPAAALVLMFCGLPAAAHPVPGSPAEWPTTDLLWGPFDFSEDQVLNNANSGAPADGSTDSAATGAASFRFDHNTRILTYSVSWQDLSAPLLDIRVHGPALPSESTGTRLFDILGDELKVITSGVNRITGSYDGIVDVTTLLAPDDCGCGDEEHDGGAEVLAALLDGHAYVNVRTRAFQNGEIRGNVPVASTAATPVPLPPAAVSSMGCNAVFGLVWGLRTRRRREVR